MKRLVLTLLASAFFSHAHGVSLNYRFFQGGFEKGTYVAGSFAGHDINNDGVLVTQELTDFGLFFSGSDTLHSFSIDFDHLGFFYYDINDVGVWFPERLGIESSHFAEAYYGEFLAHDGTLLPVHYTPSDFHYHASSNFDGINAELHLRGLLDYQLSYHIPLPYDSFLTQRLNNPWTTSDLVVSPVPLPASVPLMLSGLGVLGFAARRRASVARAEGQVSP